MSDLDTLDSVALAADEGAMAVDNPEAVQGGEPVPTGPDFSNEASGAVEMFAGLVVGYAPSAASVWTDQAKQRTALALAPVMEKYGFTFSALPPELTFAIVAGPLLWQSSRIVAQQMEAERMTAKPKKEVQGIEKASHEPVHTAPAPERHPQEALYTQ